MFERFTDRARKVMALANQEAHRFNHEFIGTENILLGMIKEGSGVGVTVLKNLGVDTQRLWHEVERLVKRGPDRVTMGKLPQTSRAKKVIEYAIEEMREMEKKLNRRLNVGTEHILLGLLRESEGIAAQVLMILGLRIEQVRGEVLALEGKKEPLMEREPRTWEDKGENKLLIERERSGAMSQYERFADGARKVMVLANQVAHRFNHEYIGTEHILLGLIKEGSGIGVTVLKNLGVDMEMLWSEVERLLIRGPDRVIMGRLPQTQGANKVIEYAIEETREMEKQLNRRLFVDTEHILLGLLREHEGLAAQVLLSLGLQIERVRGEVLALEGEKEPVMERGPRTWEDKGKKKLLIQRKGKVWMNRDEQYLKLLSVFHYVVGGLAAFFTCIPIILLSIGIAMLVGAIDGVPGFAGVLLVMISMVVILIGWTLAVCIIIAGRCLAKRKRYMFCLVMTAISCIFMPFGTVLGVFTIIVLMRPSVEELFAANKGTALAS
jgi:ATP-dependent Clp protease ATP-binding subunit ClpA